ncbi:MAG TPA: cupredoxin domain-containing protein [Aromatoleum sp.]|uniref:cupredoxin domain-containing protein n=1 Tax=Aromatoleum sp. TaxID=2307007 RepID=UPI002B49D4BC|nr:cupredoxin domain-containing protein [Aromatoleum sp.]HJV28026.1 cupredoxin domain-containing protein [Aromatoleum sp.]
MKRLILALLCLPAIALAAGPEVQLVIKDHRFQPEEVRIPAGQKVKLVIQNQDSTPEEFESHELNREKVIPGGTTASVFIGPLNPGKYPFFGEFNEKTARGVVIAE